MGYLQIFQALVFTYSSNMAFDIRRSKERMVHHNVLLEVEHFATETTNRA